MNIPSLPTDNMYKFIAIFGLTLMFMGIYFEWNRNNDASSKLTSTLSSMVTNEARLSDLERHDKKVDRMLEREFALNLDFLDSASHDTFPSIGRVTGRGLEAHKKYFESLKPRSLIEEQRQARLVALIDEKLRVINTLDALRDSVALMKIRYSQDSVVIIGAENQSAQNKHLIGAGFVIALFGFGAWYYFKQRHDDIILSFESSKLRNYARGTIKRGGDLYSPPKSLGRLRDRKTDKQ